MVIRFARALITFLGCAALAVCAQSGAAAPTAHGAPASVFTGSTLATLSWLRADPAQPAHLYLEPGTSCTVPLQSTDGGTHWSAIGGGFAAQLDQLDECDQIAAFFFAPAGRVYAPINAGNRGADGPPTLLAARGTGTWVSATDKNGPVGFNAVAVSPADPLRLYGVISYTQSPDSGGACSTDIESSADGGLTWKESGDVPLRVLGDPSGYEVQDLVADPSDPGTYYANIVACNDTPTVVLAVSDGHARRVEPAGTSAFSVAADRHFPGMLVGQDTEQRVPADQRYLSSDHGRTWRVAACPGDLHGTCPAFTVDNVLGNGWSYGLYRSGIYAFRGGGPAGRRMSVSLPVPFNRLVEVQAGVRWGDPVYLTAASSAGGAAVVAYRSGNGGRTWVKIWPRSA